MPISEISPRPGALLIAPPMMHESNFRRTVVLLCEHEPEGSFGLILNRPLGIPLRDVMPGVGRPDTLISTGGPVQPDSLHFIHRHGYMVPESVKLIDDVYWGGDFDVIKILLETKHATRNELRFFLGYAGWTAGQLDDEIEQGGWIVASTDVKSIFTDYVDDLWGHVLRMLGKEYTLLSNFPENPRLN